MIERLSKKGLQSLVAGNVKEDITCVIKFYSNTCHYCHALRRHYMEIAEANDDIVFYAFNIDDYPDIQRVMNFRGVPTISLLRMGDYGPKIRVISDPNLPNPQTYYTKDHIQDFIEKEK